MKVLETWAGPGQIEALAEGQRAIRAELAKLRADMAKVQKTQDRHSRLLGRLTSDVDVLQGDVAGLKGDVAVLKADVAGLKEDVAVLKADVAGLKEDMAEVKTILREILRRLPPERG
jgi:chromosome segregation ATPase